MKDNQHEQLFTGLTTEFETSSSTQQENAVSQETELLAQNTLDNQNIPDVEVMVTDSLTAVAEHKPAEFKAAIEVLTPYVVQSDDGSITIRAPIEVIKTLDQDSYTAICDSISQANQILQSGNSQLTRGVKIPWKAIYNAVKRSGKWVWYKAHLCTAAVVRNWDDIIDENGSIETMIISASIVCANAMRK